MKPKPKTDKIVSSKGIVWKQNEENLTPEDPIEMQASLAASSPDVPKEVLENPSMVDGDLKSMPNHNEPVTLNDCETSELLPKPTWDTKPIWFPLFPHSFAISIVHGIVNALTGIDTSTKTFDSSSSD